MLIDKLDIIIACIGVWVLADGIASLWAYSGDSKRAQGQTFWRDHALRCFRCLLGVFLIIIGFIM